jgi:hypothetical protein
MYSLSDCPSLIEELIVLKILDKESSFEKAACALTVALM